MLSRISSIMARQGLGPGAFVYVADFAMVTEDNLGAVGMNRFISRLPATYNECARAAVEAVASEAWLHIGPLAETPAGKNRSCATYKAFETTVSLYGKTYRAVVIHSSSHDQRRQKLLIWRLMERSMRAHVANTKTTLPGWDGRETDKPTAFMMTTKMTGIMVAKIGDQRYLLCGPETSQTAFLNALGVGPPVFTNPRSQCMPIIPSRLASKK